MPKIQRLPPIQYLVAFSAAAKLCSFKLAAEALSITPSAISQQIKSLEGHMGVALFSREKRVLTLTSAGEAYYKLAERTLHQYERGFSEFSDRHLSPTLKVSMIPYIANEIVIPHLQDFHNQYPEINLVIETSAEIIDLHDSELDAAIRFGIPPWGDLNTELISSVRSGLMASADYLTRYPIRQQEDWQQQTLIHSRRQVNDWQRYMQDTGTVFEPKQELYFDSYDAAMRAAEEGLGIVIAGLPLSQHKLRAGDLTLLFDRSAPLKEGLYLVSKVNANKTASYQCLLQWLQGIFKANTY